MLTKIVKGIGTFLLLILVSAVLALLFNGLLLLFVYIFNSENVIFKDRAFFYIIAGSASSITFLKIFFGLLFEWISEAIGNTSNLSEQDKLTT